MKILVISPAFPPILTAEAEHTLLLCQNLANRGLDVHVVTSTNTIEECESITVYPVIRRWTWLDLPRMAKVLKRCNPDVILLLYNGWIYKGHPFISYLPVLAKLSAPHANFVTEFIVEMVVCGGSLVERVALKVLERCVGRDKFDSRYGVMVSWSKQIIVLSEKHRLKLTNECSNVEQKIVVIPPPPLMKRCSQQKRIDAVRQELNLPSDGFVFAYFGYIYKGKGLETLLNAFSKVCEQYSNVWLFIVGGVPESGKSSSYADDLRALEQQLAIQDRVRWTGQYDWDSDLASAWLNASNACVLPFDRGVQLNNSSFSGAAAHGLPIIATSGSSLEPQFVHKHNVLLCPPKNPEALAASLISLMENPELCETLRSGVRVLAEEWFSWSNTIDRTIMAMNLASLPSSIDGSESQKESALSLWEK